MRFFTCRESLWLPCEFLIHRWLFCLFSTNEWTIICLVINSVFDTKTQNKLPAYRRKLEVFNTEMFRASRFMENSTLASENLCSASANIFGSKWSCLVCKEAKVRMDWWSMFETHRQFFRSQKAFWLTMTGLGNKISNLIKLQQSWIHGSLCIWMLFHDFFVLIYSAVGPWVHHPHQLM